MSDGWAGGYTPPGSAGADVAADVLLVLLALLFPAARETAAQNMSRALDVNKTRLVPTGQTRTKRILVCDAEQRSALAVVRSLGGAGHRVVTCSHVKHPLAASSRYAWRSEGVADPLRAPDTFVDEVAKLCQRFGIEVLFPVTEQAHMAILPRRDRFADICLPCPGLETFQRVSDKDAVLETATRIGIATPRQWRVNARDDSLSFDGTSDVFPLVIKPARSMVGTAKFTVRHAPNLLALSEQLHALPDDAFPVLLQQRIVGPGIGIFLLIWNGEILAQFSHRRLRENPPSGGGSVYCESIPADERLVRQSEELLRCFGWRGLAMVEYKIDRRTGTEYLMEINGRPWGSMQLAIDAGVDFPALAVAAACGERPRAVREYRTDVRLRFWWPDVDHFLARLRHSPERLSLPADAPARSAVVRDFFRWRRGDRLDTFRLRDPAPFVRDGIDWARRRFRA